MLTAFIIITVLVSIALLRIKIWSRGQEKRLTICEASVDALAKAINSLTEAVTSLTKDMKQVIVQQAHLYQLSDTLAMGMMPSLKTFYMKLRQKGPIISQEQANKLAQETTFEIYQSFCAKIQSAIAKSNDSFSKERLETFKKELEDIFALYSTIGPESSTEYVETIGRNIYTISTKITQSLRGLVEDGLLDI